MYEIIKPLGIVTYLLILAALTSGMMRAKMGVHKTLAGLAILSATVHALIVIFS